MNYEKIYEHLINRALDRGHIEEYTENHHIVPICMGGTDDDDNLVALRPEEHYIAHLLLVKMYPSETKLWYAANMMRSRTRNNKDYGWFKRRFIEVMREDRKHQPRTPESIEKQKETIRLRNSDPNWVAPHKGRRLSEEHRRKVSEGNRGKTIPIKSRSSLEGYILRYGEEEGTQLYEEHSKRKDSMSLDAFIKRFGTEEGPIKYKERQEKMQQRTGKNNSFYGKKHTKETVNRLKEIAISRPTVKCPHCGKEGSSSIMKRWHFDKCKFITSTGAHKIKRIFL